MVIKISLGFLIQLKLSKPLINDAGDSEIGVPFFLMIENLEMVELLIEYKVKLALLSLTV